MSTPANIPSLDGKRAYDHNTQFGCTFTVCCGFSSGKVRLRKRVWLQSDHHLFSSWNFLKKEKLLCSQIPAIYLVSMLCHVNVELWKLNPRCNKVSLQRVISKGKDGFWSRSGGFTACCLGTLQYFILQQGWYKTVLLKLTLLLILVTDDTLIYLNLMYYWFKMHMWQLHIEHHLYCQLNMYILECIVCQHLSVGK